MANRKENKTKEEEQKQKPTAIRQVWDKMYKDFF